MRHHYVPQFLLSAWADETSDLKVETFRLDLPNLPSSRRGTKYIGYDDNLYALTSQEKELLYDLEFKRIKFKRIENAAPLSVVESTAYNALYAHRQDWWRCQGRHITQSQREQQGLK